MFAFGPREQLLAGITAVETLAAVVALPTRAMKRSRGSDTLGLWVDVGGDAAAVVSVDITPVLIDVNEAGEETYYKATGKKVTVGGTIVTTTPCREYVEITGLPDTDKLAVMVTAISGANATVRVFGQQGASYPGV